jgi:ABC-type dipeptide/oligopeptide/nickel transport system permease subunit
MYINKLINTKTFIIVKNYKTFFIGSGIIFCLVICVIFAEYLAPYDPLYQDLANALKPPGPQHLLGTDILGRDLFSRIIHGSRVSILVGFFSMFFAMILGVPLGLIAGFFGSWLDNLIMRITDTLLAFPRLILALTITALLGQSLENVILALGITNIAQFCRLIRGETLSIMTRDFIRSAKSFSANRTRIMFIHILPNVMNLVLVQASLTIAHAILAEASMSFLGLGVPPPYPSWGMLLQSGYPYMEFAPWVGIIPGFAIFIAVMGFNFIGEGLAEYIGKIHK